MIAPATINPHIVEALYCEALVLADEVRFAFARPSPCNAAEDTALTGAAVPAEDAVRVAVASEGLRATTRMMHAIAWVLNQRAYFRREISGLQLRRHGHLPAALNHSNAGQAALLPAETVLLIAATRHFYDRLLRLDHAWRMTAPVQPPGAIRHLLEWIEARLAG